MIPTLLQLRTAVRQMTGTVNSQVVTDPEVNQRIEESTCALYDEVIGIYEHYFVTPSPFTITSGNTAALPADFYKDNGLDFNPGPNALTVHRLGAFLDRNRRDARGYGITGQTLAVYPAQSAAGSYQLYYTPLCTAFAPGFVDATPIPTALAPWYEYVQLRATLAVFNKRQMDPGQYANAFAVEQSRVRKMVANRTEEPGQVPLTRGTRGVYGGSFWNDDYPT